jgi:alpha-D-ribose 1-methylphosphonate 5-triphosphate synthase subunit PhnG
MDGYDDVFAARRRWVVALAALPRPQVFALATRLAERHTVLPVSVSQAGLALLPLREPVQHKVFYIGETPLSASQVEIRSEGREPVQGAAQVMADDADLADALAIVDGVLSGHLDGWEEAAALVREGLRALDSEARERHAMLTRSRVDFSLLEEEDKT